MKIYSNAEYSPWNTRKRHTTPTFTCYQMTTSSLFPSEMIAKLETTLITAQQNRHQTQTPIKQLRGGGTTKNEQYFRYLDCRSGVNYLEMLLITLQLVFKSLHYITITGGLIM